MYNPAKCCSLYNPNVNLWASALSNFYQLGTFEAHDQLVLY